MFVLSAVATQYEKETVSKVPFDNKIMQFF